MAIDTVTNESILDQYGGVRINSLDHILSLDNDDESKLLQTSTYYSEENMADIFSANINSFNTLKTLPHVTISSTMPVVSIVDDGIEAFCSSVYSFA